MGREDFFSSKRQRWNEWSGDNWGEAQAHGAFVYVVAGDHRLTKIGVSQNPTARIAQLRTASAFSIDFTYLGYTEGDAYEIEARSHEMLDNHRCNGEWFDVPPNMAVAAVAGAAHELGETLYPVHPDQVSQFLMQQQILRKTNQSQATLSRLGQFMVVVFVVLGLLILAGY